MVFITLSSDDKDGFSFRDKATIFSMFLTIVSGSLIITTENKPLAVAFLCISFVSVGPIFPMFNTIHGEFFHIIRMSQSVPMGSFRGEGLLQRSILLKLRKLTMAKCILLVFPLFPTVYCCRVFNLIDDNVTRALFMLSSAFAKSYFSSICMDAHLEVSHPFVELMSAEKLVHISRKEFLRFVFHELRGPLNSILLGAELLALKVPFFCLVPALALIRL